MAPFPGSRVRGERAGGDLLTRPELGRDRRDHVVLVDPDERREVGRVDRRVRVTVRLHRPCLEQPFRQRPIDLEGRVVELVWFVTDKRRRDADNPVLTLKALCDGLVDAEIVPDDTPEYMTKLPVRIEYRPKVAAGMALVIREETQ